MKLQKRKVKGVTCSNTQETIMLYHEKRIKPLKSAALYWHINKCADCRQVFLAITEACETDSLEIETANLAPDGFAEGVMAKISMIPLSERPVVSISGSDMSTTSKLFMRKTPADWMRLAGCVYALLLAAALAVLYNTELILISYSSLGTWQQIDMFLTNLAQIGQNAASYTANISWGFGNHVLAIAVVIGLALAFMLQREKTRQKI